MPVTYTLSSVFAELRFISKIKYIKDNVQSKREQAGEDVEKLEPSKDALENVK